MELMPGHWYALRQSGRRRWEMFVGRDETHGVWLFVTEQFSWLYFPNGIPVGHLDPRVAARVAQKTEFDQAQVACARIFHP
jgi:hypothetical protein